MCWKFTLMRHAQAGEHLVTGSMVLGRKMKLVSTLTIWSYLLAVFFVVKCFARDLTCRAILLRVDNTTAISYINRIPPGI